MTHLLRAAVPFVVSLVVVMGLGWAPQILALSTSVERSLLDDIRSAQRQLNRESEDIRKRSTGLANELAERSRDLGTLRERAAVRRRNVDEQLVSVAALEERIQQWRAQAGYQRSLLQEFVGRSLRPDDTPEVVLAAALDGVERRLDPGAAVQEAVDLDGTMKPVTVLRLGPVRWYQTDDSGGLLVEDATGFLRVAHRFDATQRQALAQVIRGDQGDLLLDPTVNQVLRAGGLGDSLLEHVRKGGVWIVPILAFALLATLIALLKAIQFVRLPRLAAVPVGAGALSQFLDSADRAPEAVALAAPQRELLEVATQSTSPSQRDDLMFTFLNQERDRLERFLGVIAVTATTSPLLGLLGTVSGMITTFSMMTIFGSGDASVVSGGISEALVTTEMGLIVAIPALIIHALLSRRATTYLATLESTAVAFSQLTGGVGPTQEGNA
ncbi:MAG: MotA/TolQ/ExbB proton channel family protein [Pseudomonadota bacterium]